jgi:lysophospholipase L1-like esterase
MRSVIYLFDRRSPAFEASRNSVNVVCAGDSITGWNNFGGVDEWPYPTYPEYLQRLCDPSGLIISNCGIAGEVSPNGIGQVRDYLDLFPNALYFVLGYGSNDLDKWPEVETTSPRIIENLGSMVRAIGDQGRIPILLDVLNANESLLAREEADDLRRKLVNHNSRLTHYCQDRQIPLVNVCWKLRDDQFDDPFHPNSEGARIIAEEVFRVLVEVRCSEIPDR